MTPASPSSQPRRARLVLRLSLCLLAPALVVACHHKASGSSDDTHASASAAPHQAHDAPPPLGAGVHAQSPAEAQAEQAADKALSSGNGPRTLGPPSAGDQRIAPAVGQWAKYHLTDGRGKEASVIYKIIGRDGDDFWLEVDTYREGGPSSKAKMLVNLGATPEDMHVKDAWLDMHGHPMHLHGPMLQQSNQMLKGFLHGVSDDMHSATQEDITVPAGTFRGCYKKGEDVTVAGMHAHSTLWRHPAVPILSLVQSKSQHGQVVQLVDYGMSGAHTSFPS